MAKRYGIRTGRIYTKYYRYGIYNSTVCIGGADYIREAREIAKIKKQELDKLFPDSDNTLTIYEMSQYTGLIKDIYNPKETI